ncbi:glucuronate isomerase [Aerococcaceae bacterium WGS1372]
MIFNDSNFMLDNETSKKLYEIASKQPIFDYHCHLDPQEVYEDKPFDNIVDVWLGGDHYKWRLMRANGVNEKFITGDGSNEEKFKAFAETIEFAVGNPLFHWTHLELRDVFGIDEYLTSENWERIYNELNDYIQREELSPRKLINRSNVEFIGTTDHPLDSLEWHAKIKEDTDFDVVVAPTFRPDEAFVDHANFAGFVDRLRDEAGETVENFETFIKAMENRIKFFVEHGAKASDISFGAIVYREADQAELDATFEKAMNGKDITREEAEAWQTEVFVELSRLYKESNIVSQVHFGAIRNNNTKYSSQIGPDAGFDSIGDQVDLGVNLNALLDRLSREEKLPKMIWYNLNPQYNFILANTLQNYQANEEGIKNYMQFGAAWWFADTKNGMLDQMDALANSGMLANFLGMLTDSRSFLSYQRHDYFRRILATFIGDWVEREEIPNDEHLLTTLIENISYKNAYNYFNN